MATFQYCTPEWLEACAGAYGERPEFEQKLKKLSVRVCFKVKAEPSWGIGKAILFGSFIDAGKLTKLAFFSETDARRDADYILSATPQEWKKILRKENKFVTDFMLGKIKIEQGSKVGVLSLAPHGSTVVAVLTQVDLQFPDEMSDEELVNYRTRMEEFRARLGV